MSVSQQAVRALAQQYGPPHGVPAGLLYGLLAVENPTGNTMAEHVNANGSIDVGLAQINNVAHPEVSFAQATNPNFAVAWAATMLASLKAKYGTWVSALEAYNSGGANSWDYAYAADVYAHAGLPAPAGGGSAGAASGAAQAAPARAPAAGPRTAAAVAAASPTDLLLAGPASSAAPAVLRWALLAGAALLAAVALLRIL